MMPTPPQPPQEVTGEISDEQRLEYGFLTPEEADTFMDTTGLLSCCIYMVSDHTRGKPWEYGDALRCVRGHVNVVMGADGRWRAIEAPNRDIVDDFDGPVNVKATHPSYTG